MGYGYELGNDESLPRLRLGDCWVEGCLRGTKNKVALDKIVAG